MAARNFSSAPSITGRWRFNSPARLPGSSSKVDEGGETGKGRGNAVRLGFPGFAFHIRKAIQDGMADNSTRSLGIRSAYQAFSNGKMLSSRSKFSANCLTRPGREAHTCGETYCTRSGFQLLNQPCGHERVS